MEIDLETKQQLAELLAKPALVTHAHAELLTKFVETYPYYQPLHLLLAKATENSVLQQYLATAALYNGGNLAHQVIYHPESLIAKNVALKKSNDFLTETQDRAIPIVLSALQNDEQETFDEITELAPTTRQPVIDEQETFDEIGEAAIAPASTKKSDQHEEEIFEEIAEIPPVEFQIAEVTEEDTFEEISEIDPSEFPAPNTTEMPLRSFYEEIYSTSDALPNEMAIESIVASDFFAFERNFPAETIAEHTNIATQVTVNQPEEYNQEAEEQTVSKYDDDKLPYTFLWWLAKTRKEHAQIFQPYVTTKNNSNQPTSELQQQYVEHIFHLQTPFNVGDEATKVTIGKTFSHRGDEIIDSFIRNEPQIRAPKAEQINNENKAKKSAEDHNDLVSETLAAIYIEQMLYHKAIETYEKLSLKFPEKSRYFADLIQSLEKKI